jgi:hypothetical protein
LFRSIGRRQLAAAEVGHIHAEKHGQQQQKHGAKATAHGNATHTATTAALTAPIVNILAVRSIQTHGLLPYR